MDNNQLMRNFHKIALMIGRARFMDMDSRPKTNPAQLGLLALLVEVQEASQKELVQSLDIRPSSLSELLKKLEGKGYIERRQDPDDKRNMIVSLTEAGEIAAKEMAKGHDAFSDRMFAALSEEEKAQLNNLLEKLIDAWRDDFSGDAARMRPAPHSCEEHPFDGHPFGGHGFDRRKWKAFTGMACNPHTGEGWE